MVNNATNVITYIIAAVGVLVVLTNIITEVLKGIVWKDKPTSLLAMCVAMVVTLVAFFAACAYTATPIRWYCVAAAIMLGFMVAYAAMYGFDKFKDLIERLKK